MLPAQPRGGDELGLLLLLPLFRLHIILDFGDVSIAMVFSDSKFESSGRWYFGWGKDIAPILVVPTTATLSNVGIPGSELSTKLTKMVIKSVNASENTWKRLNRNIELWIIEE